jgi:hypothetical protein
MKEIKSTILCWVLVRTFVIPFYYDARTVINYGSGSDFLTSYDSGSTRQKVAVPTVPVPKHCLPLHPSLWSPGQFDYYCGTPETHNAVFPRDR